jgi:hypothetical protein
LAKDVTLVFTSFARLQDGRDATRVQFGRKKQASRPLQEKPQGSRRWVIQWFTRYLLVVSLRLHPERIKAFDI